MNFNFNPNLKKKNSSRVCVYFEQRMEVYAFGFFWL